MESQNKGNIFCMEVVNMLKRKEFEATETFAYHAEQDLARSIVDSFFNKSIDGIDIVEIDDSDIEKFMSVYRKYCKKFSDILSKNLIDTLIMCGFKSKKSAGFSKDECAECLVETVNQMLEAIKSNRSKLNNLGDKRFDKYFSKLTMSNVKQAWLSGTSKYVNRIDIFKICFALGLKSKHDENYIEGEPCYENLFNKVFNQRYCLKRPDEMCFSYCLKVGKSYGDALGLYNKYLGKTNSKSNECNNIKTGDDTQTMFNTLSDIKNDDNFIKFLLFYYKDFLNNNTSIKKYLIGVINSYEEDEEKRFLFEKNYSKYYSKYHKNRNTIPIKLEFEQDKKYYKKLYFADNIMINDERIEEFRNNLKEIDFDNDIISQNHVEDFYLINQILVILNLRKKQKNKCMGEIDEWEIKRDTHNQTLEYYNDMRKLIIITNFLDYFIQQSDNKIHSPAQKSEEFICHTNDVLKKFNFNYLYSYNNFDLFFYLCSLTIDPMSTYYRILDFYYLKLQELHEYKDL